MLTKLPAVKIHKNKKSHFIKGEFKKTDKLDNLILKNHHKEAIDIQQRLFNLTNLELQNVKQEPILDQLHILSDCFYNGQFKKAEKLAISITKKYPREKLAWKILGAVQTKTGRNNDALISNKILVSLSPQDPNTLLNLAETLKKLNRLNEAEKFLKQAIALSPRDHLTHLNLANTIQKLGRLNEAENYLKQSIILKPDYVEAHYNLGIILQKLGRLDEAINYFKKVIKLNPNNVKARKILNDISSIAVPGWHLSMMNDTSRNSAYYDAIKLAVEDGIFVLDIGTGSGLLSMMAANSGAGKVITCEVNKTIAEVAKEVINSNGLANKISVINKKSTDLIVGEDLPQKADLIISEVLSSEFVGEGVRNTAFDANKRLLKTGAKTIPQSGKIRISLVGNNQEVFDETTVINVNGFDLSKFNAVARKKVGLALKEKPLLLSKPYDAFNINLCNNNEISKEEKIFKLKANKDGLCLGIIQWFKVHLYKGIEYENKPGDHSHWRTPIYLFDEPVMLNAGDILSIRGVLGLDEIWFHKI